MDGTKFKYTYPISGWRDQLLSFNGEECEYNEIGNPTKYRGRDLTWQGRRLISYGKDGRTASFTYDADSVRTSKVITENGITRATSKYIYDGNTLVAEQRNGEWIYYIYGVDGIAGFNYQGNTYLYRKNIQGDITHIYTQDGVQVAHYAYDAYGNIKELQPESAISQLNPFRYRGYYYDIETGLYYLISRYYDPETGRFISADGIEYLDPETICGLNLYAYCCNNPVMMTDETGNMPKWLKWLIAGLSTAVLVVGAVALTIFSGGTFSAPLVALGVKMVASVLTGAAISATFSLATAIDSGNIDLKTFFIDTGIGAVSGLVGFGMGKAFSIFGKGIGAYLNEMVIGGLRVGDVFGSILPIIFSKSVEFGGGILFGMMFDKNINLLFNKRESMQERFFNNLQGGIFSSILDFVNYLW